MLSWLSRKLPRRRDTRTTGAAAEKLADRYLRKQGYRHVQSNYTTQQGEIDLIMQDGPTIVFVEVKSKRREDFTAAESAVNLTKRRHIESAANLFIAKNRLHDYPFRFDVVAVVPDPHGKWTVRHQQNAFSPGPSAKR